MTKSCSEWRTLCWNSPHTRPGQITDLVTQVHWMSRPGACDVRSIANLLRVACFLFLQLVERLFAPRTQTCRRRSRGRKAGVARRAGGRISKIRLHAHAHEHTTAPLLSHMSAIIFRIGIIRGHFATLTGSHPELQCEPLSL